MEAEEAQHDEAGSCPLVHTIHYFSLHLKRLFDKLVRSSFHLVRWFWSVGWEKWNCGSLVHLIEHLLFRLERRQRDGEMFTALEHLKDPILCFKVILTDFDGSGSESRVLSNMFVV